LHSFKGEFLAPLELAYEAIHVERHLLKDNVGCQDQVLAAVGGFNLIEFRSEQNIIVHRAALSPLRLSEFEQHLFIVFTGVRRSAFDVAATQLKKIRDNTITLRRMRAMVDHGWDILTGNKPLVEFGKLLHESWMAKRSLDGGVSTAEIDQMYERGRQAGAWGGKLLGAGGGGFLLLFAPPEAHSKLKSAFSGQQILSVKISAPGSEIIFTSPSLSRR
jgi:D-glycero-alpha-D-manno-heptose-7-phosphate kinase